MAGNVWEWVGDWYSASYYAESSKENPMGPVQARLHVKRGGGFLNEWELLSSTNRQTGEPTGYGVDLGFRCVIPALSMFP